jgi:hypothetical protein
MEFKQVIGLRRSIRYHQPYRAVERAKVQSILEAAPLCSQAINSNWAKAIVVNRDDMAPEDREALKVHHHHHPAGHGAHLELLVGGHGRAAGGAEAALNQHRVNR